MRGARCPASRSSRFSCRRAERFGHDARLIPRADCSAAVANRGALEEAIDLSENKAPCAPRSRSTGSTVGLSCAPVGLCRKLMTMTFVFGRIAAATASTSATSSSDPEARGSRG